MQPIDWSFYIDQARAKHWGYTECSRGLTLHTPQGDRFIRAPSAAGGYWNGYR